MKRRFFIALSLACALAGAAAAQQGREEYQQRHADLVALSGIFGDLHAIRRICEPRFEADIWRERMKKLIALEEPQPAAREEMVASFNKAYARAQRRFSYCDRRARDYAAARAAQGDVAVERLMAPLYEAAEEDETPFVWSAPAEPADDQDTE